MVWSVLIQILRKYISPTSYQSRFDVNQLSRIFSATYRLEPLLMKKKFTANDNASYSFFS
eukprot:UN25170